MDDYGSVEDWVRYELLLPYIRAGGDRFRFWTLTPRTLKKEYEELQAQMEFEEQKMWLMGVYVANAISSSAIVSVPFMDSKKQLKPLSKYPKKPHSQNRANPNNKEWVENEKQKLIMWLNSFKSRK